MNLKEAATHCLTTATDWECVLIDNILLEQVYLTIPARVHCWLSHNRPLALAKVACLLENFFWAEKSSSGWPEHNRKHRPPPPSHRAMGKIPHQDVHPGCHF